MRVVLIVTTAATFLAHALVGCCWHHAHGAAGDWSGPRPRGIESATAECSHQGCGHAHPVPAGDASHDHHAPAPCRAPHDCDEPWCLFVTTVKAPSIDAPTASWLAALGDFVPPLHAATVVPFDDQAPVGRFGADSLRGHLALCVLRI
jgi:hypothetical protein